MKRKPRIKSTDEFILANDPSFTAWGWAVINQDKVVVDSGIIETSSHVKAQRIRAGDDRVRRIGEIVDHLLIIIDSYNIKYMVSELPHGSQLAVGAVMNGAVTAILQTISICKNIGVEWYSESDAKKSVTGSKKISKQDMVHIIDKKFESFYVSGIKKVDEAVADALAVYNVAIIQSPIIKYLVK